MKLNSQSDQWRVTSDESSAPKLRGTRRATGHSLLVTHHSRSGIALVITLIMLSVTLVMAVAFLAIARRERGSVTTTTDTTTARLAAEAALAGAEAQIVANILSTNSAAYDFGLLVSTNYINAYGFISGISNPTNVSYTYGTGLPLTDTSPNYDQLQNIANLWFLPRAPVFVTTNKQTGSNDFRFYLDLNRNGQFEDTGTNVSNLQFVGGVLETNGTISEVGDPQWVGILEHPDQPHGPNNHFIARYAFLAQPIGNSLDLNYIHDQTLSAAYPNPFNVVNDGYFRNEGVGSWEINLAAFLADMNTNINEWGQFVGSGSTAPSGSATYYQYGQPQFANSGNAFADAQAILSWRYGANYNLLATPTLPFYASLVKAGIDGYTSGNLMTNTFLPLVLNPGSQHWAGSDNTNRFFALPTELYDATKSSPGFVSRLGNAGTNTDTYDRYTFYRMLSQIGSDSLPESGKLNLNYRNVTNGVIVAGMQTNLYPWTALEFFTNAADRLLRLYTTNWFAGGPSNYLQTYYAIGGYNYYHRDAFGNTITNDPTGFGLTNVPYLGLTNAVPGFGLASIPVYINSNFVYSSAVNRVLQLAANIFDASTNTPYPSVFRPRFSKDALGNIFITGYTNVVSVIGTADLQLSPPFDVATIAAMTGTNNLPSVDNIYGVPWIIGVKKGLPNFNEFSMENVMAVTRRLQVTRAATNAALSVNFSTFRTNQMYLMSLNSLLGVELWNSYNNNYTDPIMIGMNVSASLTITNNDLNVANPIKTVAFSNSVFIPRNPWPGSSWLAGNPSSASFVVTNFTLQTLPSIYRSSFANSAATGGLIPPCFVASNYFGLVPPYETNSPNGFFLPQFGVLLTNRLQVFILDGPTNGIYHVIDYAHFAGPNDSFNVNSNLVWRDSYNNNGGVWDTNYPVGSSYPNGVTAGILQQIASSKTGTAPAIDEKWNSDPDAIALSGTGTLIQRQAAFFQAFFLPGNKTQAPVPATNTLLSVQAPYSPTRYISDYITWQANDPLVHYLASDIGGPPLNYTTTPQPGVTPSDFYPSNSLTSLNLGRLNDSYMPWGGNTNYSPTPGEASYITTTAKDPAVKDPLVAYSDNWAFPTNKYPTVGWLGRVHRGTPWQTVFLKSTNVLAGGNGINTWAAWTGDRNAFDATNSAPNQDVELFDVFTTALNDNATRGTLSVNQNHLAAWSALLSGLAVPTSLTNSYTIISPAGVDTQNSAVWQIVTNINMTRSLFPLGVFTHLGDIVRAPMFAEQSPFIAGLPLSSVNDAMYEWLPQQTMGLLRVAAMPRFAIYGYGQTLKPAPNGVVTSGGANFFGLVTNYQVTAENAVRAVVSVHPHVTATSTGFVTNYTTTVESYNPLPPN